MRLLNRDSKPGLLVVLLETEPEKIGAQGDWVKNMQTEHEDEREHRKESFDDPAERQHSEIQNGHSCEKNNAEKEHPPETSEDGWNLKEEVGVPKEEEEEA